MAHYRMKPTLVEAVPWSPDTAPPWVIPRLIPKSKDYRYFPGRDGRYTLAQGGDWFICDRGLWFLCPAAEFARDYEPVSPVPDPVAPFGGDGPLGPAQGGR